MSAAYPLHSMSQAAELLGDTPHPGPVVRERRDRWDGVVRPYSDDDVATPDLVTDWFTVGETPTPVALVFEPASAAGETLE